MKPIPINFQPANAERFSGETATFDTNINALFDRAPCALAYVSSDLVLRTFNVAAREKLGISRAAPFGVPTVNHGQFNVERELFTRVQRVIATGERMDYQAQQHDGSQAAARWMHVSIDADRDDTTIRGAFISAIDITDEFNATRSALSQQMLIDQHLDDGVVAFAQEDAAHRIQRWSGSAERLFGWSEAEAKGKTIIELGAVHPEDVAQALIVNTETSRAEINTRVHRRQRNRTKDGREIWCDWYTTRVMDHSTGESKVLAFAVDVTDRVCELRLNDTTARTDSLTKLPNRYGFFSWADDNIKHGKAVGSLLFIDLDGFKEVNDRYGHEIGDALLVQVAATLKNAMPQAMLICRYGGDEFIAFQQASDNDDTNEFLANRIKLALRTPFEIGELCIEISCSIGIVQVPKHGTDPSALVKFADLAMYEAKNNGKDQHSNFTTQLGEAHTRRIALYAGLRKALRSDQFSVQFQPRVSVNDGRVIGAEALARWCQFDGTVVSPAQFIPVAEETGLIHELGVIVMRRACEFSASINQKATDTRRPFVVSINVSGFQLRYQNFVAQTEFLLEQTRCHPSWIEFEITESRAVIEPQMIARLHELSERLGVKCSLDDFGTGFSNLGEISSLPISTVKIDRSFIQVLSNHNSAVVAAIIALAQSLKLQTVAEGVETQSQLDILKRLGCNSFQGFLHSTPMNRTDFSARFAAHLTSTE